MDKVWELISAAKKEKNPEKSLKILQKALNRAEKDSSLEAACYLEMATYYKLLGLHKKEIECLSKTEQLAKTLSPTPRTAALLSKLAGKLRQLGEYKKSLHLLKKALPLFENPPEKAAIFCNMGNCYYELNQYKEAIKFYTKAKQTFETMNYPIQRGICLQNIGNALREMNEFKKSLKYYEKALNTFLQHNCTVDASHVLWNQAIVYDELEQFEKALSCYDKALSVLTEEDPFDVAKILNDKGLTLRKLTRYKEALHLLEKALSLFNQYNMPVEALETRRNIAGLKRNMDLYEEALHDLYSVKEELQKLEKPDSIADVEWEIANVYACADQPGEAITYYDKVLKYYRSTKKHIFAAKVMRDKAAVVKDLGEYDEALTLYFQAETVFTQHNLTAELASTILNRGNLYRMLTQFKDAQKMFEKAKTLYQKAGMDVHAAVAEFNKAAVLGSLSKHEEALSVFQNVEAAFLQCNQPVSVAETQINEAVILGELGRYKEAFSMFESARKLLKDEMVSHHLLIDLNEGALLLEVGQHDKAQHTLESVFKRALQANSLTLAYKAYWALGYMYEKEGQLKKAYYYLRKCLKLVEKIRGDISPNLLKMSFFSGIEDIYSEMVFLTCKMGMKYTAFSVLQKMKARTLTEQMVKAEKSAQAPRIPGKISKLYSTLHEPPVTYEKTGETLKEITRLETEYAETITRGELFQNKSILLTPHMKVIQSQLTEREALIEYIFDEENLLLFLVTSSSFNPVLSTLENNLQEKIYEYLYRIRSQSPVEKLSQSLYNTLINPVRKYLAEDSILHIVPYRELYLFPFHALHYEGFLAETYQFMYHPTSALITKTPFSPEKILVVGNPDKDVKGVEKECTTISSIAKKAGRDTTLLLKENATKERFYQLYSDHDIIHIACHGVYDSFNPLRSGLKLFDGILTALEMHHLNLKGKLLVLGACGSGSVAIEKGSELLGITRALLCAGSSTITSLWEVPDTASVIFWRTFYKTLLAREEVPRALQRAQQFMISTAFSHPYFWAGYRIMG